MAPTKPEAELTLERAYCELFDSGQKITARALRGRAEVDMDTAAAWLRARRTADKPPSGVPDKITATTAQVLHDQIVEPIRDRRLENAVAHLHQTHAEELRVAIDDAESARHDAGRVNRRAEALASKDDRLAVALAAADRSLDDLRVAQWQCLADIERARADVDEASGEAEASRGLGGITVHSSGFFIKVVVQVSPRGCGDAALMSALGRLRSVLRSEGHPRGVYPVFGMD